MGGQVFLVFRHSPVNKHKVQLQRAQCRLKDGVLGIKERETRFTSQSEGVSVLPGRRGDRIGVLGLCGEVIASET